MGVDLPLLWAIILGVGLMMYVTLDGFDLGIGILFPFVKDREQRDVMVDTVAPVWDGNETWLVLGGAGLLAAFPMAYAVILSALYLPLIFMLAGLIWRGVAFEFRFKADVGHRPFWDKAFIWGSYVATVSQGISLGAIINGFRVERGEFAGGMLDWLTPFSLFTGLALVVAYALLGATWLVFKTDGTLAESMRRIGRPIALLLLLAIVVVSLWTPISHPSVAARWFSLPTFLFFVPVPLLVLATTWGILRALDNADRHVTPFLLALFLLFLGYSGLVIGLWPYLLPPSISIWDAAGAPQSLGFTLVGALAIIPCIMTYSAWSYFVFRGKVRPGESYH